jgi:hypothetical protein
MVAINKKQDPLRPTGNSPDIQRYFYAISLMKMHAFQPPYHAPAFLGRVLDVLRIVRQVY